MNPVSKGNVDSRKPCVGAANRNVEDEIEALVERRIVGCLRPRVGQQRVVLRHGGKVATVVHVLLCVKVPVQHLLEPAVHVREQVVLRPFQAELVVPLGEVRPPDLPALVGLVVGVRIHRGAFTIN